MDLRRLRCVGPCACGGALVVLMVPPLRFILASQAGLAGWRAAAMPSSILAGGLGRWLIGGGSGSGSSEKSTMPRSRTRPRRSSGKSDSDKFESMRYTGRASWPIVSWSVKHELSKLGLSPS